MFGLQNARFGNWRPGPIRASLEEPARYLYLIDCLAKLRPRRDKPTVFCKKRPGEAGRALPKFFGGGGW